MLTERVKLIGQNLYETIPNEITISSIPTASELEFVGAEEYDRTIIEKILPKVIENSSGMDFYELLDIDYDWVCRCLRLKSYGPYFTTNRIFCPECDTISRGEYQVDLRRVNVNVLPEGFVNTFRIDPDTFIDYNESITFHLLTCGEELTRKSDTLFNNKDGRQDAFLSKLCYMIDSMGKEENMTPVLVRSNIKNKFSAADYELLKDAVRELTNYGLENIGHASCPNCGSDKSYYIAFQNDKFFRPSVGDVKRWKSAIRSGEWQGLLGDPSKYIRIDS